MAAYTPQDFQNALLNSSFGMNLPTPLVSFRGHFTDRVHGWAAQPQDYMSSAQQDAFRNEIATGFGQSTSRVKVGDVITPVATVGTAIFAPEALPAVTSGLVSSGAGGAIGGSIGGPQGAQIGSITGGTVGGAASSGGAGLSGEGTAANVAEGTSQEFMSSAAMPTGAIATGGASGAAQGAIAPAGGGGGGVTVPPFGGDTSGQSPSGMAGGTSPGPTAIGTGAVPQGGGFNSVTGVTPTSPGVTGAAPINLSGTSLAQPSISDIAANMGPMPMPAGTADLGTGVPGVAQPLSQVATSAAPAATESLTARDVVGDINSALNLARLGESIFSLANPPGMPASARGATMTGGARPMTTVGPASPTASLSLNEVLPSIDSWAQSQLLGIRSRFARLGIANSPMEQQAMRQFELSAEDRVNNIAQAMRAAGNTDPRTFETLLSSNLQTPQQFSDALGTGSLAA